jgi:integrase
MVNAAVDDPQTHAALLLMLNACMYAGEVAAVQWDEIDLEKGTLVTRRSKTNVVRIAVLWQRTIIALKTLPRLTDSIFISVNGMQHNYQTLHKQFRPIRKSAGLEKSVQLSHIRDGAYTAAVESGISLETCQLLAGHETGISDYYVQRRPQMVSDACQAIERAYFD